MGKGGTVARGLPGRRALADRGVQSEAAEQAERRRCGGGGLGAARALASLSLTQTSLLQLSPLAIGLTQRAGTSGERRAHWLRGARRSCSDYHISAPPRPCATDRAARPRDGIRAPRPPALGPPLSPGARRPADRASASLSGCRSSSRPLPRSFPAAPPGPSPPVAPLLRPALLGCPPAVLRAGLTFLPPRASGWWVGLPDDEVPLSPPRVLADGPLGTAGLAWFDLALGRTAPGLAALGCPGG